MNDNDLLRFRQILDRGESVSPSGQSHMLDEITRLSKELEEARGAVRLATELYDTVKADLAAAKAEVERLGKLTIADTETFKLAKMVNERNLLIGRLREGIESIGCKTDHGEQDPCDICAIVDGLLALSSGSKLYEAFLEGRDRLSKIFEWCEKRDYSGAIHEIKLWSSEALAAMTAAKEGK